MVRDLNKNATGTPLPWHLSDFSETGEALIFSEDANSLQMMPVCVLPLYQLDGDDIVRVSLDARRIVAAVNLTHNIPLETLEDLALSPPLDGVITVESLREAVVQHDAASREAAYYFPDED